MWQAAPLWCLPRMLTLKVRVRVMEAYSTIVHWPYWMSVTLIMAMDIIAIHRIVLRPIAVRAPPHIWQVCVLVNVFVTGWNSSTVFCHCYSVNSNDCGHNNISCTTAIWWWGIFELYGHGWAKVATAMAEKWRGCWYRNVRPADTYP